jgi:cytochrome bd-type quinol oxidase subunit 1
LLRLTPFAWHGFYKLARVENELFMPLVNWPTTLIIFIASETWYPTNTTSTPRWSRVRSIDRLMDSSTSHGTIANHPSRRPNNPIDYHTTSMSTTPHICSHTIKFGCFFFFFIFGWAWWIRKRKKKIKQRWHQIYLIILLRYFLR